MSVVVDLNAESARRERAAGAVQQPAGEADSRDRLADDADGSSEVPKDAPQPVLTEQMDQWLEVRKLRRSTVDVTA